jgi:hypothetical protein
VCISSSGAGAKVEWVEAALPNGQGSVSIALRQRRPYMFTAAQQMFAVMAPVARHPHAIAAAAGTEPTVVRLAWYAISATAPRGRYRSISQSMTAENGVWRDTGSWRS